MFPHGGDQNFIRELEKYVIEFSRYSHRILDQVVNDIYQFLVGQNASADFVGGFCDFVFNRFAANIEIDDNLSVC
jgi:hypothetical protein